MKSFAVPLGIIFVLFFALPNAQAVDINLVNIDMGSPESEKLADTYGKAYGFPGQQVTPALMMPAQETPAILQIAQAAGTIPMTVWMMRKMGMNYGQILGSFALAPSALMGGQSAPNSFGPGAFGQSPFPGWMGASDPFYVQMARVYFLRDILKVRPEFLPWIPTGGPAFSEFLVRPNHPVHGTWLPPGIAKKYGLWVPPGQRKKMGWWGYPAGKGKHGKHHWKKSHWKHDWDGHYKKGKGKGKSGFPVVNFENGQWEHSGKGKGKKSEGTLIQASQKNYDKGGKGKKQDKDYGKSKGKSQGKGKNK